MIKYIGYNTKRAVHPIYSFGASIRSGILKKNGLKNSGELK